MRARLAQATVRALFGRGAATLAYVRPSMTKGKPVCRTPIHLSEVILHTKPTYKGKQMASSVGMAGATLRQAQGRLLDGPFDGGVSWLPAPRRGGRVSNPPLQAGTAVGQHHRLPASGHVGPPLRLVTRASPSSHSSPAPRRGGRVSNPPLQAGTAVGQHHRLPAGGHVGPPLRLVTRASPSSHPSPARHRERGSDVSCLVVLSGWGLPGG